VSPCCAGDDQLPAMWEPSQGTWRDLPYTIAVHHEGYAGCVLSDGTFAVLRGWLEGRVASYPISSQPSPISIRSCPL